LIPQGRRFSAGNLDRPAFDLDIQLILFQTGRFGDDDDIITLAEYVERRKAAGAACAGAQPRAAAERIERLLQPQQGLEWISIEHDSPPSFIVQGKPAATAASP